MTAAQNGIAVAMEQIEKMLFLFDSLLSFMLAANFLELYHGSSHHRLGRVRIGL